MHKQMKGKAPEEAESTVPVNRLMCIDGHVEGQSLSWAAHLRVLASRRTEHSCTGSAAFAGGRTPSRIPLETEVTRLGLSFHFIKY